MGRPALSDDLPHPRPGPAAVPDPGDRLDLSNLRAPAQPAGGALPHDPLRLSRRQSRRRGRLSRIGHDDLVDDVFGLIDHLNVGRAFLVGISFGSTVTLRLSTASRGDSRAALQGGFAHRTFTVAERWALRLGRFVPGTAARLPMRRQVLAYNSRPEFPSLLDDRWDYYIEQNGLTTIRSLAHRIDLLDGLDLRPILAAIPTEILLLQGNEDRIVPCRDFEVLKAALPRRPKRRSCRRSAISRT